MTRDWDRIDAELRAFVLLELLERERLGPDLGEWVLKFGSYGAIDWAAWDAAVAEHRSRMIAGEFHAEPYREIEEEENG
jgi:hypothetical protein